MKPLVVISSENSASLNIKSALLSMGGLAPEGENYWKGERFDMAEYSGGITEIVPKHDAEYYIFASTHKSASNAPSLTVHTPGNWGDALLGGQPRTLNVSYASKVRAIAQELSRAAPALGYQFSVEVDHHGPTLLRPVLFAEIGSSETQWSDQKAGTAVARAIVSAVQCEDANECVVGFGGTHYAPKFSPKIAGGLAVGHIISGYSLERDSLDSERLLQAFQKNVERVRCALIDWKGIKGEVRTRLVSELEALGLAWEKA